MGLIPGQKIEIIDNRGRLVKTVAPEELSQYSKKIVKVQCDYCGEVKEVTYYSYIRNISKYGKYACSRRCASNKIKQTNLEKYGVENPFQNEEIKDKIKSTNIKNLGVEYPSQSKEVREKIKTTNLEKFGVENPFQNESVKEKIKQTNVKKYGVENPSQSPDIKDKKKDTFLEHYGYGAPMLVPEIKTKALKSLSKSSTLGSPQENGLFELISSNFTNTMHSVPLDRCILDIVVNINGVLIDIEADGYYWHCNKKEDKICDIRRDSFTISQNHKVLRIVYNNSLPSEEEILNAIFEIANSPIKFKRIWSSDITDEQIKHFDEL